MCRSGTAGRDVLQQHGGAGQHPEPDAIDPRKTTYSCHEKTPMTMPATSVAIPSSSKTAPSFAEQHHRDADEPTNP